MPSLQIIPSFDQAATELTAASSLLQLTCDAVVELDEDGFGSRCKFQPKRIQPFSCKMCLCVLVAARWTAVSRHHPCVIHVNLALILLWYYRHKLWGL